jgi:hypothetical protein
MWFVPTFQDMRCIFVFIVLTALSFLCSHFFIMEHASDSRTERMQVSILVYGSSQSLIGFVGGFYISKLMYSLSSTTPYPTGGYGFVKSDDDIMEV